MRKLIIAAAALASTTALAACAGGMNSDAQDYAQLQSQCEAKGGRFVTTGRMTGRAGLDNACKQYNPTQGGPESSRDAGGPPAR